MTTELHATNEFLEGQIKEYTRQANAGDENAAFRLAVLKSFVRQDGKLDAMDDRTCRIETQTGKTSDRVAKIEDEITKLWTQLSKAASCSCAELKIKMEEQDARISAFERPVKAATTIWKAVGGLGAFLVVAMTLLFAFMATDAGKDLFANKKQDTAVVEKLDAMAAKLEKLESKKR